MFSLVGGITFPKNLKNATLQRRFKIYFGVLMISKFETNFLKFVMVKML